MANAQEIKADAKDAKFGSAPRGPVYAISLWQPWATLVARGAKTIETRSWRTPYRGLLAIHAAKQRVRADDWPPSVHEAVRMVGGGPPPQGGIVAVGVLLGVARTEDVRRYLSRQEHALGDYSDGRYAWHLGAIRPVDPPVPCQGRQRLWLLDRPTVEKCWERIATLWAGAPR